MDKLAIVVSIIGILGTLSTIFFAYLSYKRSNMIDEKNIGKTEGSMFSNINHIKSCMDRLEINLNKVDERYQNILERLAKVEEAVANLTKQVDNL